MKKFKKILALALSLAMVLGMSVTTFAEGNGRTDQDTAIVTIKGIERIQGVQDPTVTLYRIARGEYGTDFKEYVWTDNVGQQTVDGTTKIDVADVAKRVLPSYTGQNPITPITVPNNGVKEVKGFNEKGDYEVEVYAGAYIAIISGGGKTIYNPVLLTATYGDANNTLVGGSIDLGTATYDDLSGSSAVTKMSKPEIKKEITSGTEDDGDKKTASVGDVIGYKITPTMPEYPENAANKTAYIEDNMSAGLTFNYESLTIKVGTESVPMDETSKASTTQTFTYGTKVIARSQKVGNGFKLIFDYEQLADETTGTVPAMTVEYNATLNANAVVAGDGNTNEAKLVYSNDPNKGSSYTDPEEEPDPNNSTDEATVTKDDTNTVYTYQLAFLKTGEGDQADKLPGATFGIYSAKKDGDVDPDSLVDTVITSDSGYAISKNVKAGTYYVKEIAAPAGYSLNTTVYEIEASYAESTTTVTKTEATYTSELDKASSTVQVGWLKNGTFYPLTEKPAGTAEEVLPAYLATKSEITTATTTTTPGSGVSLSKTTITNTKLSSLPSTGGIGTTIFTIGGCAIMILAAGLYFASRRKSAK